jgi:hypothetical protein
MDARETNAVPGSGRSRQLRELSRAEMARVLDERAQQFLGMSGEAFLTELSAGRLPDSAAVAHVATIAGGLGGRRGNGTSTSSSNLSHV